jgi:hypothetical protein
MHDDDTEEWPEATAATPKRVVRMRGRIRHVAQPDRVLTPDEARALLAEGKRIRRDVEARVDRMERIPMEHRTERAK